MSYAYARTIKEKPYVYRKHEAEFGFGKLTEYLVKVSDECDLCVWINVSRACMMQMAPLMIQGQHALAIHSSSSRCDHTETHLVVIPLSYAERIHGLCVLVKPNTLEHRHSY